MMNFGVGAERGDVAQLLRRPLLCWCSRYCNTNDFSGVYVDDEEREERPKPNVVHLEKIARPDRMIAQECAPSLAIARRAYGTHVTLYAPLRDADAKLEKLSSDAFGTPRPVLARHAADELDDLRSEARLGRSCCFRTPFPEKAKTITVPPENRLWLDQENGVAPPR